MSGSDENSRYILFDHDDTLASTLVLRARVFAQTAAEIGCPLGSEDPQGLDYMRGSHGRSLEQMALDLTADEARASSFVERYRTLYYEANKGAITTYEGIPELLSQLAAKGIPMAVVTSKLGRGASEELDALGLRHYFATVVGAEHVSRPKPDPEPLQLAMAAIDAVPARCVMIGDTRADILGARAAGTRSAAALWGSNEREGLLGANPDYQLGHPRELLDVLEDF